jgi:hypothetical protein
MNIKKLAIVTMLILGVSATSQATEVKAADKSAMTNLCMTALSGNRAAMHNNIKASGYSKNYVAKNVNCNGINILAFIQQHGKNADAMLRILDRKT